MMEQDPKSCLRCKYLRVLDSAHGWCRVDKGGDGDYPLTGLLDTCPRWRSCGQHYFIRLGWLKAQAKSVEDPDGQGEKRSQTGPEVP